MKRHYFVARNFRMHIIDHVVFEGEIYTRDGYYRKPVMRQIEQWLHQGLLVSKEEYKQ